MTIAFLTGYFAFLPASVIGVSGVLAVVTAGVYIGWHTPELTTVRRVCRAPDSGTCSRSSSTCCCSASIGLQLRPILDAIPDEGWSLAMQAAAIVLAVVLIRIVWVFAVMYLPSCFADKLAGSGRRRHGHQRRSSPGTACAAPSRSPQRCSSR